jgi:hypothetical protein
VARLGGQVDHGDETVTGGGRSFRIVSTAPTQSRSIVETYFVANPIARSLTSSILCALYVAAVFGHDDDAGAGANVGGHHDTGAVRQFGWLVGR